MILSDITAGRFGSMDTITVEVADISSPSLRRIGDVRSATW
jgi:hypothetical protein